MLNDEICPICGNPFSKTDHLNDKIEIDCPSCRRFRLTGSAHTVLAGILEDAPEKRPLFSYIIHRKRRSDSDIPEIDSGVCRQIALQAEYPPPAEQANNLLRLVGDRCDGPGEEIELAPRIQHHLIGSQTAQGLTFIIKELELCGLIVNKLSTSEVEHPCLTLEGWSRYEELRRGAPSGRKAFMAMPFNNQELDAVVNEHMRPAVEETGFKLRRLDDEPKAGLIDDRLRVELQECRFLIADLTTGNYGAYWEAGYAEGLGKPVIYTCRADRFQQDSHFDTNHHLHVNWDPKNIPDAMQRLKDTIRATIPEATRSEGE